MTSTTSRPPGRPRSAQAEGAIIDAVIALLVEGTSVESLTLEAVAARAGVGKATIYRRWQHKDALVLDAVASVKPAMPELAGESVRDDLVVLTKVVIDAKRNVVGQITPCLMPELKRNTPLRQKWQEHVETRRQQVRSVLQRGIDNGELRPDTDVEVTLALLTGPALVSTLGPVPLALEGDDLADRVVDAVLRGIAR